MPLFAVIAFYSGSPTTIFVGWLATPPLINLSVHHHPRGTTTFWNFNDFYLYHQIPPILAKMIQFLRTYISRGMSKYPGKQIAVDFPSTLHVKPAIQLPKKMVLSYVCQVGGSTTNESQEKVERQWTSQKVSKGHGTCNFLVHLKLGTLLGRVHFEVEQASWLKVNTRWVVSQFFLIFTPKPLGKWSNLTCLSCLFSDGLKHYQLVHVTLENVLHLLWNNVSFETSLLQISGGVSLIPSHKNWDQPRYRKKHPEAGQEQVCMAKSPWCSLGRWEDKKNAQVMFFSNGKGAMNGAAFIIQ